MESSAPWEFAKVENVSLFSVYTLSASTKFDDKKVVFLQLFLVLQNWTANIGILFDRNSREMHVLLLFTK